VAEPGIPEVDQPLTTEALENALRGVDVTRISDREQKLANLASQLRPQQRAFVEAWSLGKMKPTEAMRAAGYAEETIKHKGPTYVFRGKGVMAYATALCDERVETVVDVIKGQLLSLETALPLALDTLVMLAAKAENENVRVKAASVIVDLCKGLVIASLPKKSLDFTSLMKAIYEDAREERKKAVPVLEVQPWPNEDCTQPTKAQLRGDDNSDDPV
jgi:hypothetical protein